MAMLDRKK